MIGIAKFCCPSSAFSAFITLFAYRSPLQLMLVDEETTQDTSFFRNNVLWLSLAFFVTYSAFNGLQVHGLWAPLFMIYLFNVLGLTTKPLFLLIARTCRAVYWEMPVIKSSTHWPGLYIFCDDHMVLYFFFVPSRKGVEAWQPFTFFRRYRVLFLLV